MIQRAGAHADITEIADRIAIAVRPWRVVLFGSRARGDPKEHSDYDLYVEVDAERAALRKIRDEIWSLLPGGWSIDLHVRCRGEIERRRDDPGTIEWDVAREGKVLYADPAASTVLMPLGHVREPSPQPPESMHEWLASAERDLRHRKFLWESIADFAAEICGLCHSTCEKHMKALLVSRYVRPARTHNLTELLTSLRQAGCELSGLDDDCVLLTKHAVDPRYAAGLDLTEDDARVAFAAAERVVNAVRAELPHRLH